MAFFFFLFLSHLISLDVGTWEAIECMQILKTYRKKYYLNKKLNGKYSQTSRCSIVVSIPACHAGDPGSIPGNGEYFHFLKFDFKFAQITEFVVNKISSV